jgi:MFS family permease
MRWLVVCWLSLGMVIAYCDRVNLTVALPRMAESFTLDAEQQGRALSAFFWTYTLFQIPAGMLVDRYGARTLYLIGFLIWSVASALTTFTTGLLSLIAFRLMVGTGEAVVTSSSLHYIRSHFAEKERGLAVGIYMTGTKIGPAVGLPLAGFLVVQYGWQTMFFVMGAGCLLWLIPWMTWVKSSDPAARGTVTPAARSGQTGSQNVGLAAALSTPVMWGVILGTFCYMYFVYYCMTWMPQYFQKVHGMSLTKTSWYSGVSFAGMAAVAALAGWWADRIISHGGDPVRVRKAFTIAGFLMAATQTFSVFVSSEPLMIFFTIASLCGLGLATANYWALTQTLMPGALPVAIQNTAANLAGIVSPWLTGIIIKQTGSFDAPIKVIGFWLLLGIGAYVFLVRQRRPPVAEIRDSAAVA